LRSRRLKVLPFLPVFALLSAPADACAFAM
jgi:hypothetical protein